MPKSRPDRDGRGRFKSRTRADAGHQAHEGRIKTTLRRGWWLLLDAYRAGKRLLGRLTP